MKSRLIIALLAFLTNCLAANLLASVATFQFAGTLFQVGGPNGLAVGDPFTGSFSYTLQQPGVNLQLVVPGQETRYVLDRYTLTIQGQTLSASGGRVEISNDVMPWLSYPQILWDSVYLSLGSNAGTPLSGSLNSVPISSLSLSLVNTAGQPFLDTSLPTALSLGDFQASAYMDISFANLGGSAAGQITSLQVIPEPSSTGLVVLFGVLFLPPAIKVARRKGT